MTNLLKTIGIAIIPALASAYASAADLPSRIATQVAPPPPAYTWTGIYLGANVGYGWGQQTPMSLFTGNFNAFDYQANGWLGGVTAGAQIQSGHTLLGIEGDIAWTDVKGSGTGPVYLNNTAIGTATLSSKLSSISTLRARVGYAADNWLLYGTGGVAITRESSTLTSSTFICGSAGNPSCASPTDWHVGLAVGAGLEYGITQNLSTKIEYMWVGAGAGNTLKENMVRLGLNYRFGQ
jgi:outer membrane immunogenic protein